MIKKIALIELIQDRLAGLLTKDQRKKYPASIIAYYIGRAYSMLLFEIWGSVRSSLDNHTKTYTGVAVQQDGTTEVYYSTLPADILIFPDVNSGVRKIATTTGEGVDFVPETNDNIDLMEGLLCDNLPSEISYTVKNGRVEYKNMDTTISTVRMDLVIPFEAYSREDSVFIPSGQDERLIEIVTNYVMGKPPVDLVNDNNPNTNMIQQ
jgi:hypothetical protein